MNQEIEDIFPSRGQLAVIVSGVVSMGLEILAGRVLAPRFGSSVYTWGTIIGVSMLALSIGYARGGRTSENITYRDVEKYLAFTSLYILSLVFFGEMAINWSADLVISSRYAVFIPATVLFGPPTYFLGYISPYAAQLSSKDSKGGASGHFYAIGTMGSIIGVFATTFLLIPYFTVDSVYLLFASLSLTPLLNRINHFAPLLAVSIMLVRIGRAHV